MNSPSRAPTGRYGELVPRHALVTEDVEGLLHLEEFVSVEEERELRAGVAWRTVG